MYHMSSPAERAVQLLFNCGQSKICTKQPIGCTTSATFIVDVTNLNHSEDIRADDLGVWSNKGVRTNYVRIDTGRVKHVTNLGRGPPSLKSKTVYTLKRTYWKHTDDQQFSRRLLELKGIDVCEHVS